MNAGVYKWLTWILGALSVALLLLLAQSQMQLNRTKSDIRFARELVDSFQSYRHLAAKSDAEQAAYYLRKLQLPAGAKPFENVVADFVERERKQAVEDVLAHLRNQTGNDFGDDPEKWIQALEANGAGEPK